MEFLKLHDLTDEEFSVTVSHLGVSDVNHVMVNVEVKLKHGDWIRTQDVINTREIILQIKYLKIGKLIKKLEHFFFLFIKYIGTNIHTV
jgi:hypothetical protein